MSDLYRDYENKTHTEITSATQIGVGDFVPYKGRTYEVVHVGEDSIYLGADYVEVKIQQLIEANNAE